MKKLFGLCLLGLSVAQTGYADFIRDWCGNTRPNNLKKLGGAINVAILDRRYGEWGDTWGTGLDHFDRQFVRGQQVLSGVAYYSPHLDTSARYLYLYQVVNEKKQNIQKAIIEILDMRVLTSWGYFGEVGFHDEDGKVDWKNPFGSPAPKGHPSPYESFVRRPSMIWNANVVLPNVVRTGTHSLVIDFSNRPLQPRNVSVLYGFTSNHKPTLTGVIIKKPQP